VLLKSTRRLVVYLEPAERIVELSLLPQSNYRTLASIRRNAEAEQENAAKGYDDGCIKHVIVDLKLRVQLVFTGELRGL
jgi:hypothetical protein